MDVVAARMRALSVSGDLGLLRADASAQAASSNVVDTGGMDASAARALHNPAALSQFRALLERGVAGSIDNVHELTDFGLPITLLPRILVLLDVSRRGPSRADRKGHSVARPSKGPRLGTR